MDPRALEVVLSGANPLERVVAVEPQLDSNTVNVFVRNEHGGTDVQCHPFVPWLVTQTERYFPGANTTRLTGDGYCWRIDFPEAGWRGFLQARRTLNEEHAGVMQYGSAAKQFLIASGITLFKGMAFEDLRRLQLDIETATLSPRDPEARIFLASIATSDCIEEVIFDTDEAALLSKVAARVIELDPGCHRGPQPLRIRLALPRSTVRSAQAAVLVWARRKSSVGAWQ